MIIPRANSAHVQFRIQQNVTFEKLTRWRPSFIRTNKRQADIIFIMFIRLGVFHKTNCGKFFCSRIEFNTLYYSLLTVVVTSSVSASL